MPLFRYKVSDADGTISIQQFEGDSQADAARRIQRRGMIPLEFLGDGQGASEGHGLMGKKFNVVEFTDRLVPLLEANIPLERSLGIIGEDQDNKSMSGMAGELRRGLHEGRKLSDLIRERGTLFPQIYAGVVEAGEEAGALPQVMGELRRFLTEAEELKSFIISASIYPAFIAVAGVLMLVFILGVIVPRFATALTGAGIKSVSTDILIGMGNAMHAYWWVGIILVVAFGYLVSQIRKPGTAIGRSFDNFILKVPILGKLALYSNIARLCRTMAILMRSGVHLLNTVSIANRVVQNHAISQSIIGLSGDLRQGQRLSAAFAQSEYIPSLMVKLIAVGEEIGNVESMLERIAERYEEEMRRTIKRLLSLFEPIVIVCLGLSVGTIVLLMFLAIMDMQSAAG